LGGERIVVKNKDTPNIEAMPQRLELHPPLCAAAANRRDDRVRTRGIARRDRRRRAGALARDLDRIDQGKRDATRRRTAGSRPGSSAARAADCRENWSWS